MGFAMDAFLLDFVLEGDTLNVRHGGWGIIMSGSFQNTFPFVACKRQPA